MLFYLSYYIETK